MTTNNDAVIGTLNNLIETCADRQSGYRAAAEAVENHELKTLLRYYEQQSARHAAELRAEVRRLGGDPQAGRSVAAWFLRGWMNLKSAIAGGDESAIIAECERGEDAARANYESALKEPLPVEVQAMVQRQLTAVRERQARPRALEVAGAESSF